jgi:hypothetical protein
VSPRIPENINFRDFWQKARGAVKEELDVCFSLLAGEDV